MKFLKKMLCYSEVLQLTASKYDAYLRSLIEYSEVKNVNDTAFEDSAISEKKKIATALKNK